MNENKKLMYWLVGIFSSTFLLVMGVMAHDRQIDKCMIDHLFDFHFDADHVREQREKDIIDSEVEKKMQEDNTRRQKEWANEIREWYNRPNAFDNSDDDSGTSSGNDSNDCNRDR